MAKIKWTLFFWEEGKVYYQLAILNTPPPPKKKKKKTTTQKKKTQQNIENMELKKEKNILIQKKNENHLHAEIKWWFWFTKRVYLNPLNRKYNVSATQLATLPSNWILDIYNVF